MKNSVSSTASIRKALATALILALALTLVPVVTTPALAVVEAGATAAAWTDGYGILFVKANGDLYAWGENQDYRFGTGKLENSATPVYVMGGVASVSAGHNTSFAVKTDGALWAWGRGERAGVGTAIDSDNIILTPVEIMKDVAYASGDGAQPFAIKTDGTLWMWYEMNVYIDGEVVSVVRSTVPVQVQTGLKLPPAPPGPYDSAASWARKDLETANGLGLIPSSIASAGWTKDTTRLDAAKAIVRLIEKAYGKTRDQIAAERGWTMTNHFPDTQDKDVTFLRDAEIARGSAGRYNPTGTYTRAEMAVMIGRTARTIFGIDTSGDNPFSDVESTHFAAGDVGYMYTTKITTGSGGKFTPNRPLTNQETIVFALRAFGVWK
jgi:hypothetical protein